MRASDFRLLTVAAALTAAIASIPSLAQAQSAQSAQPAPRDTRDGATARIQYLEHDGQALMAVQSERAEGARLMELAGFQRSALDPTSVSDLLIAGSAYYWSGHPDRARAVLTRLGERAEGTGGITNAANAYVMAAWIANDQHDGAAAAFLVQRIRRLAASPRLSDADRRSILDRITDPSAVALKR